MYLIHKDHKTKNRGCPKAKTGAKIKTAAAGCLWMAGLLIAGSESPYMPWLNIFGVLLFAVVTLVSGQWLSSLDLSDSGKISKKISRQVEPYTGGIPGRIFSSF
ncbi:MAG: hypothetical protein K9K21_00010 [Desulfotignum sp.]|nr:hypothetical protein [Desulfotignum sp.]MCF8112218.1 hypothetical protein [Desulfotignum sp.]MCF8125764.1 hypothetical protein [Desulfotignum sp.]